MTFSYYHSAKTLPADLQEVSTISRQRPWQRFFKLEVPFSMIGPSGSGKSTLLRILAGLIEPSKGEVFLNGKPTEQGKAFAEAGVLEEKKVFRDQALTHISILRQIVHALETAPGHTLPEEYFLSLLETRFNEEEAQAQLDTAINWGRYAELFTFQDDRGIFKLEESEAAEVG